MGHDSAWACCCTSGAVRGCSDRGSCFAHSDVHPQERRSFLVKRCSGPGRSARGEEVMRPRPHTEVAQKKMRGRAPLQVSSEPIIFTPAVSSHRLGTRSHGARSLFCASLRIAAHSVAPRQCPCHQPCHAVHNPRDEGARLGMSRPRTAGRGAKANKRPRHHGAKSGRKHVHKGRSLV